MNRFKAFLLTLSVSGFKLFNSAQWYQIYTGFRRYNLSRSQVKVYAKRWISAGRMRICKHALSDNFSESELEELLDMKLHRYLFRNVIDARFKGVPSEEIKKYLLSYAYSYNSFYEYVKLVKKYEKN